MEYVGNGSLRQRIRPRVGLALDEAVRIVGETCDALQYAHSQGIVHRDIKPENILFGERHEVKLADFGIAKLAGAMTVTQDGLLIGTPYYMSYEQAKGLPVDARSDIYALGVVLYEMLTGCVPFTGDALTVVHKHLTEMPVPPSRLSSSIPPHVEQVVLKALEKDVNKRYANAEQMARALGYTMPFSQPGSTGAKPIVARPAKASLQRPSSAPGRLTVLHSGHVLPLVGDVMVLHRRDINPDDALISRDHARIVRHGGNWWLEDIRSTNGTFLNGQRIFEPVLVRAGDEVRLGSTTLRIG
jgi:serine/threonine-protein kinase